MRAKAQTLVTHGLYSRIRNPIYVFGALVIAGIFLFSLLSCAKSEPIKFRELC